MGGSDFGKKQCSKYMSGTMKRIKPMTISKHLGPESELDNKEITTLRGLLGAIQ